MSTREQIAPSMTGTWQLADFDAFATDYLVFAHAYLEQITAMLGRLLSLKRSPAFNRSATLFLRKYYDNGAHAGFILYMSDTAQQSLTSMREALRNSRGRGISATFLCMRRTARRTGFLICSDQSKSSIQSIILLRTTRMMSLRGRRSLQIMWLAH